MAIDQMEQVEEVEQVEEAAQPGQIDQDTPLPVSEVPEPAAPLAVVGIQEVEVKRWHGAPTSRVFGWQRMAVKDALRLQDETFRCPECLGRVRLRQASAEKRLAEHAEHYSKNTGCSLGNCFSGERQLHAKPLN